MTEPSDARDHSEAREAALARARIHQPLVDLNSAFLVEAARDLIGLDHDLHGFEAWLEAWRLSREDKTA